MQLKTLTLLATAVAAVHAQLSAHEVVTNVKEVIKKTKETDDIASGIGGSNILTEVPVR